MLCKNTLRVFDQGFNNQRIKFGNLLLSQHVIHELFGVHFTWRALLFSIWRFPN